MSGRPVSNERRFLLPQGPPPPYNAINAPPAVYHPPVDERNPERPRRTAGGLESSSTPCVRSFLVFGGLVILIAGFLMLLECAFFDIPDPIERARIRQGWQREQDGFAEDRRRWLGDSQRHQEDLKRWEEERVQHEEAMKRWAEERARQMGMMWEGPHDEPFCHAYNTRGYWVKLDPHAICRIAPITMGDHTVMAEECDVQNGQVIGRYRAPGDSFCQFTWNELYDKSCTTRGEISGIHTYEARLWGLHNDRRENWQEMCNTTPATINNVHFDRPTRCHQDRHGLRGDFEYEDRNCAWGNLHDAAVNATKITASEPSA